MNTKSDEYVPVVDISKFQRSLDAGAMAAAGVVAVIIRASDGVTTPKRQGLDPRWPEFHREAAASPLKIGSYHFWRPQLSDPRTQARFWLEAVRRAVDAVGRPLDLPLMADVEEYTTKKPLTGEAAAQWLDEFLDVVEAEGADLVVESARTPNVYTGSSFWKSSVANSAAFGRYGLILARYPTQHALKDAGGRLVLDKKGNTVIVDRTPPKNSTGWAEFAWGLPSKTKTPAPPLIPGFTRWDGWQFSGDGNSGGRQVGVGSAHVDCNIFLAASVRRWTGASVGTAPGMGEPATTARGMVSVPVSTGSDPTEVIVNALPDIRPGTSGDHVKRVQALLLAAGFAPGVLDGKYTTALDSPTRKAVVDFQSAHRLTPDGNIGVKQTWPALLGL